MINILFFLSGLIAVIVQTLLLREMLVVFQGNELTIGLILSEWMIGAALGSYFIGILPEKFRKNTKLTLSFSFLFIAASFVFGFLLVRDLRGLLHIFPGAGISFYTTLLASFFIVFPNSFFVGTQFSIGVNWAQELKNSPVSNKIYFLESLGYLFGGIVFTYLLCRYLTSSSVVVLITLICFAGAFLIQQKKVMIMALPLVMIFMLSLPFISNYLETSSISGVYKGFEVKEVMNSFYGQIAVLKNGGEENFCFNGTPQLTLPNENVQENEEFAYLSLLFHEKPKSVLLIGGWGKYIKEMLKYPGVSIDYAELDPDYIKILKRNWPPGLKPYLEDRRVKINYIDGRSFLEKTLKKYDIIVLGVDYPNSLSLNRYFTYEFFTLAKEKLNSGGVFAFKLPGSLVYIDSYLKKLLSCIKNTLDEVFIFTRILPGDTNIFLGFKNTIPPYEDVKKRFLDIKPYASFLSVPYLDYRLDPAKENWLNGQIKNASDSGKKINMDFIPEGLVLSIIYWQAVFAPTFSKAFLVLIKYSWFLWVIILVWLVSNKAGIYATAFTSGLAGMGLQMANLFAVQVFYGNIYHIIGLLSAAFMAGLTVGSVIIKPGQHYNKILKIEILFCFWIVLFYLLFKFLLLKGFILFIFSFGSGALLGMELPVLIWAKKGFTCDTESKIAGFIYGFDLLGGFFAALVIGTIVLPVWGMEKTLWFLLMFKLISLKWWALSGRS